MVQHKVMPALLVAAAIVPILYIAAPLVHMFSVLTWRQVGESLVNPDLRQALATSAIAAVLTTIAALVFGLPTAYLLSSQRFRGKRLVEALLLLPIVLPPVVGGVGELFLYGPMTPLGAWLNGHNVELTNSLIGVVLAQLYITSPFMILAAKSGFDDIPIELKEVTRTLGGGMWHVFWYVSIPLAKSAILSGMVLTFARAVGEFGATMIMAYHPYTLPVEIWVQFSSGGLDFILPIAAVITLLALLVALLGSVRGLSRTNKRTM